MNLKALAQHFSVQLKNRYEEQEISSIFSIVVEELSGWSRSQQVWKKEEEIPDAELVAYLQVLQSLSDGQPVQYVLRKALFFGLDFIVNPSVLIPRPETEELVDWVLESCRTLEGPEVIDIGTGSGCIAISLAKNLPQARVSALDVSSAALEVARENAVLNEAALTFIESDIRTYDNPGKFDIIVSNPPYITLHEKAEMHEHVLSHEPHLALFVPNESPLVFYEAIADFALRSLKAGGYLFFEINEHLGAEMIEMLRFKSFININLRKDMQGKDRMISCSLG